MEPLPHALRPTAVKTPLLALGLVLVLTACGDDDATLRAGSDPAATAPITSAPAVPSAPPTAPAVTATPATPAAPEPTGSATPSPTQSRPTTPAPTPYRDPKQRYEFNGTVLESPKHGPEICAGAIAQSYPPQCGGVPVTPFSWADVSGEESDGGTTWGAVRLVGTFDGTTFRLTERPGKVRPPAGGGHDATRFDSKCPPPPGGWRVVDRSKTGDDDFAAATEYANAQPDVSAVWIDHLEDPPDEHAGLHEGVLNVAFTGNLDAHERALRQRWGGALCVSKMARPRSVLTRAQDRLQRLHDEAARAGVHVYGSSVDELRNITTASVLVADAVSRRWVDEHIGPGLVELEGIFRPVG